MSETISLYDQVAIAAMAAIIAKKPFETMLAGEMADELAVARGAHDYAAAFMAIRAERDQPAIPASVGEELRLLRQQRDEALAELAAARANPIGSVIGGAA